MADSVRLPVPGSDEHTWGEILNAYLLIEHTGDGTLRKTALIDGAEQVANKDQATGYAGLDANGKLNPNVLPANMVGDYLTLYLQDETLSNSGLVWPIPWTGIGPSHGESLGWSSDVPGTISVLSSGVYSIDVHINWNDSGIPDTNPPTERQIQIMRGNNFRQYDQRAGGWGITTIQSTSLTIAIEAGRTFEIDYAQTSSMGLVPNASLYITKVGNF